MTIHLPKDVENSIVAAVHGGHFPSADDALAAAWRAFEQRRQAMTEAPPSKAKRAKGRKLAQPTTPLSEAEVLQHMLSIGFISQLPDTDADFDDPDDQLITIKGEPISETIIRERR